MVLIHSTGKGRCPVLIFLTDGLPTLPHGPAEPAQNLDDLTESLRILGVRKSVFVISNEGDQADVDQLERAVGQVGGRVIRAGEPPEVSDAILEAANSCHG